MDRRFNKYNVSELIHEEINVIELRYHFDPNNGRAQVIGKDEHTLIAFGRYEAMKDLHMELFGKDINFYNS